MSLGLSKVLSVVCCRSFDRPRSAVSKVHFRRGSAFSEDALRQAYQATTFGTPLEGAALEIDTVNLDYTCACGYQQVINSDDLEGHMFICPDVVQSTKWTKRTTLNWSRLSPKRIEADDGDGTAACHSARDGAGGGFPPLCLPAGA